METAPQNARRNAPGTGPIASAAGPPGVPGHGFLMKRRLLAWPLHITAMAVMIGSAGCGRRSRTARPSTETELMVRQVLSETFAGNAESWFAVEKTSGRLRLVELHGPTMGWRVDDVSETERMNGVTEKAAVWVNCRQFRRYDGRWSEWQQGTGAARGVGGLLLGAMGPLAAQWSAHLQKKHGRWVVTFGGAGSQYQRNRAVLLRILKETPR